MNGGHRSGTPARSPKRLPAPGLPATLAANPRLSRWIDLSGDGVVVVRSGKVELGQGIVSALAQIVADELDVVYARVRMQPMDTRSSPNEGPTTGSRSIQEGGGALRQVCAEVRALFVEAAARRLGVDAAQISVDDGRFRVDGMPTTHSYWTLANQVSLDVDAAGHASPKDYARLRLVGESLPRLDILAKITGAAFIHDLDFPGMLHGRIVRSPSPRAELITVDTTATAAIAGVQAVVREGQFLGVVALREETAIAAARQLAADCRWRETADLPDSQHLADFLFSAPSTEEVLAEVAAPTVRGGEPISATFTRPYLAHASIGPSCGLAIWHGARATAGIEFWSHTQSLHALRDDIAHALGVRPEHVVGHVAEGAGCYGHNGADDVAFDAVMLARALPGRVVRVQWMREDEFAWEPYGPAGAVRLCARLRADGSVANWSQDSYGNRHIGRPGRHASPALLAAWQLGRGFAQPPAVDVPLQAGGGSQRNAVPGYAFPNLRVANHGVDVEPLRVSSLRALGAYLNVFAIESFVDELAHAAGADPLAYRLRHLQDPRGRAVLEALARRAQWQPRGSRPAPPEGDLASGRGLAYARYKNAGCYAAAVVDIEVGARIRVCRVTAAIDCGRVVSPDGVLNQIEGGIVQALSWSLTEALRFDRRRVTSRNWDSYPILGFDAVPAIDVVLLDRPDAESLGVGETMTGPVAAALANALHDALGLRVRDLPLTPERIAAAIAASD